jgi:hypothetical protein
MTSMSLEDRLRFDPNHGTIIRMPPGAGYGYWVGGMKVSHDPTSGTFALFYRERTPLERGRGGRCAVALSEDGVQFDDVWQATKEKFASSSIEVGHAVLHSDGEWRLYISYEREPQGYWRVDLLRASHPSRFDAQYRRTVLEPSHFGVSSIKDPWVQRTAGGGYQVYCAVPSRTQPTVDGSVVWVNADDATVVAESDDGVIFRSLRYVYEPPADASWHGHRGRVDSRFAVDGEWVATFSGGRSMYDNYEEPCGLMVSPDPVTFRVLDTGGPWIASPHGCVRYVFGLAVGAQVYFYYEYTRSDGSHDMRVSVVDIGPKD